METVLVVGSSGNMGVSAIIAAQRSNRAVIAVVRNDASKQKVLSHIDSPENVTFVEADVTSDDGLQDVVDRVRKGDLPAFQHVFATVGLANWTTPIQSLDLASFREVMKVSLESNYREYSIHLLAIPEPNSDRLKSHTAQQFLILLSRGGNRHSLS